MARLSTPARSTAPSAVARVESSAAPWRPWLAAAVELTKPRITKLVTITSGVGFLLSALLRSWDGVGGLVFAAAGCLVGTSLSAAGAHALNEWLERDRDARMPRTANRPLPAGKFSPLTAWLIGSVCGVVGVLTLWLTCGLAPALVSLATILLYVLVYTPLKVVTPLSTIIGAVPGALPPLIGWSAAAAASSSGAGGAGSLGLSGAGLGEVGGWSLFLLMFVWQIPHFLAIAWMYREDYAKGGFRMLPLTDPDGRTTFATILIWATLLLPATVLPAMVAGRAAGVGGTDGFLWIYAIVAVVSGTAYLAAAWRLAATQASPREEADGAPAVQPGDRAAAKRVFVWSIIHLPLLLVALVADALLSAW